jgi:hypothetical protein
LATGLVRRRVLRIAVAVSAAVAISVLLLQHPGQSRGGAAVTQASVNVAVIPGFTPPTYPGFYGVPALPTKAPQLAAYHFSQLAAGKVTTGALSSYDTAILYGIRWADISASGQAAINAFAKTHKVLIWDSDDTGSQHYASFIHPFSEQSSGENFAGKTNTSVDSIPKGVDFLASDQSSSPYYLNPNQLVTDRDEINDMNAMTTGTKNWLPALIAANAKIPKGGWPLAWSYGVIGNHTGLTVYSGLDADAFGNAKLNPNNAIMELQLELKAPFRTTPDTSCAPNCQLTGSGSPPSTHAACSLAKKVSTHWVHGRVPVWLKTSVAAGITGRVLSPKGKVVASAKLESGDVIHLGVKTKRLRTNHASRLRAQVLHNGQVACSKSFRLKVDNTRPRLLYLRTTTIGSLRLVSVRVSEAARMQIVGGGSKWGRGFLIARGKLINAKLSGHVRHARLIIRDRAGNMVNRQLAW